MDGIRGMDSYREDRNPERVNIDIDGERKTERERERERKTSIN